MISLLSPLNVEYWLMPTIAMHRKVGLLPSCVWKAGDLRCGKVKLSARNGCAAAASERAMRAAQPQAP